jgi:transcriptional regulator with XRE-family HTH domain
MKSVSQYLKRENMTQTAFAAAVGVRKDHISRILAGIRNPSLELLRRISKETGVDFEKLSRELKPDKRAS